MKIESHIGEEKFNYKLYKTNSDKYLVIWHGSGEYGNIDGSELNKVEKYGYTLKASTGTEFPFNIIAVQGVKSKDGITDFSSVQAGIFPLLDKLGIKEENVGFLGFSQGAMTIDNFLHTKVTNLGWKDVDARKVKFIISVGGKLSGVAPIEDCKDIDFLAISHKLDLASKGGQDYVASRKLVESLKTVITRTAKTDLVTLDFVTNNPHLEAWNHATDPKDTIVGKMVYDYIVNGLQANTPVIPIPAAIEIECCQVINSELIITMTDNSQYKVPVVKIT